MNEDWLARARQAKLIAQQAKKHLPHIHDLHYPILNDGQSLSNSENSIADYSLNENEVVIDDTFSGPTTQEVPLMIVEGIHHSLVDWSPIPHHMTALANW